MSFPGKASRIGFGVFKTDRWDFAGIYDSKTDAEAKANELGEGYRVAWGEHRVGSTDFVW